MVGHYRVVSAIGAGGMGTVYQGLDTRLNRPVALKAIADRRKDDPHAVRRLRAEALAAAALDHPYICKIYELVETDAETLIVMEFVEGETLASRLRRGPLPLAEALHLASEVAEGLANAHAHGMVHRDVKPGNVMVTPHGHVKLLDFGLAQASSAATSLTRTATGDLLTRAGTPAYMSPEQVLGRPVSAQSDLFAFGTLLFECLTGETPFHGIDPFSLANNIVSAPAKSLEALAPQVPTAVVSVVSACLAKEPASRPASASAVAAELRRLAELSVSGSRALFSARAPWGFRQIALVAAALAIAGVAGVWTIREWRSAAPGTVLRQQQLLVGWPSEESESRISPDAKFVSFLSTSADGATRIFVQAVGGGNAQQVVVPDGEVLSHLWSPDGSELVCAVRQSNNVFLQVVPAPLGGTPRSTMALRESPEHLRLLRWIGPEVYLQTQARGAPGVALERATIGGGPIIDVSASWDIADTLRGFDVAPGGKRVVYAVLAGGQEDLWVTDLDGKGRQRLTDDRFFDRYPLWADDGRTVLYQSNRSGQIDIWEVSVSDRTPRQVTSSQTEERPDAVSADGSMVTYDQYSSTANIWRIDLATERVTQLSAGALSDYLPATTPVGPTIVFQRGPSIGNSELMVGFLEGSALRREPQTLVTGFAPRLSRDGRSLAYLMLHPRASGSVLHVRDLETGQDVVVSPQVRNPGYSQNPPIDLVEQTFAWAADGREVWFIERGASGHALRRYRLDGGLDATIHAQLKPGEIMRDVVPAADGRRITYLKVSARPPGSFQHQVRVVDVDTAGDVPVLTLEGGPFAVLCRGWTAKDQSLVVLRRSESARDQSERLDVFDIDPHGGQVPSPAVIERAFVQTLRVDPDRRTFYVTRSDAGVHNLYAVPFGGRRPRALTSNRVAGVSFSGVARAPGAIIFARDERKRDIYLSRIER